MKILAVITARGGSKRLPRKNMLQLGGRPLISWTIDLAKEIKQINEILVSTDSDEIAQFAKSAGALVPWLRPHELSRDESKSIDVVRHAVDFYQNSFGVIDGILLLQPTSPFRSKETITRGIKLFQDNAKNPVVGVTYASGNLDWNFTIEENHLAPISIKDTTLSPLQTRGPIFTLTGGFYLISPEDLFNKNSFVIPGRTQPLIIESSIESLDIDTELDFYTAQAVLSSGQWPASSE